MGFCLFLSHQTLLRLSPALAHAEVLIIVPLDGGHPSSSLPWYQLWTPVPEAPSHSRPHAGDYAEP